MREIVKGWAWPSSFERRNDGQGSIGMASSQIHPSMVPAQLVPDDGTYKVVSVEEWEQHEACETFARWAYDSLRAGDLDLDMLDIQEKLAALGLVEERPVNPDENEWGADMLFFWKTDPPSATTPGGESHD